MDQLEYIRLSLGWITTVAVLWPLNIPLAGLAYKIRQGHQPIDMESQEFWTRCTLASLILAGITLAFVWLDYELTEADLPPGPVHLFVLLGYLAAASWLYFVFFALEDFFQALGMVVIYLAVPIVPLLLFNYFTRWWNPLLNLALDWLKK